MLICRLFLCWRLLQWLLFMVTVGVACYFSSSIVPGKRNSVCCHQCKIFSWLMQAVQQVHDRHSFFPTSLSYLSSHSNLMSQLCFSWLSWGLSSGRHARMLHAGFTTWLLDWFLRISPKTDRVSWTLAGLNNCGFGSFGVSQWKKLAALGRLRLTHSPGRAWEALNPAAV